MIKVLGIGESVVDTTSIVKRDNSGAEEVLASYKDAGGPVLSALILLSRLGYECSFMTSLGQDTEGKLIRDTLKHEGVRLIKHLQPTTKKHTIVVNANTGQREKFRGTTVHSPIQGIAPSHVRSFDIIIVDRHERTAFYEVIKHKSSKTLLISDPSTEVSAFTLQMLRHSACPIVPIESLAVLGQGKSLVRALQHLYVSCGKSYVVTLGELGSLIYDGQSTKLVPPLVVTTIDTLGAGDVYRGAFAHMLAQDKSLLECAVYANTAAALQCTKQGNAHAIPSKDEINHHLHNTRYSNVGMSTVKTYFSSMNPLPVKRAATPATINV